MDTQAPEQAATCGDDEAVLRWLRQNAIPIRHVEAGHGFADLQPLKTILKDVKVVGLGEATHGTREFFQFKHRLFEFLAAEMGFTAFVIEGSYTAFQPINDYILEGKGDLATVLTGQGYVVWDTEELMAMLAWMRAYNQRVPDERKVKIYGADIAGNSLGREAVLGYLREVGSERLNATAALFEALAREEAKWPGYFEADTPHILAQLLPQVDDLIAYLTANQAAWASRTSLAEFENILQYACVMQQWLIANTPEALRPAHPGALGRSEFMAQNMLYLLDHDRPDAKYAVWAHNGHVSLEYLDSDNPNWGHHLRERYGSAYYSFGFDFNRGSFHNRTRIPGQGLGELKAVSVPPAPAGWWPWYLAQVGRGDLILNLRAPAGGPQIAQWLNTPRHMRNAVWAYDEHATYGSEVNAMLKYDGVIFIEATTPARPTANGWRSISKREGL